MLGTILLIRIWWIVNSRICRKHGCNKYASNIHAQYANNMQYAKKKNTTCKICKIKHLFLEFYTRYNEEINFYFDYIFLSTFY